jgi:hypothetical protein
MNYVYNKILKYTEMRQSFVLNMPYPLINALDNRRKTPGTLFHKF